VDSYCVTEVISPIIITIHVKITHTVKTINTNIYIFIRSEREARKNNKNNNSETLTKQTFYYCAL